MFHDIFAWCATDVSTKFLFSAIGGICLAGDSMFFKPVNIEPSGHIFSISFPDATWNSSRLPLIHDVAKTQIFHIMTSSNGNISRVTGALWGESTGHRWIPLTEASNAEIWCFLYVRLNKQSGCRWFETPWRSMWSYYDVGMQVWHVMAWVYFQR